MKLGTFNDNALVVRDNRLVMGRFNMTAEEYRVVLWLISEASEKDDAAFDGISLSIEEFARFCGVTGKSVFETMAGVTGRLVRRAVDIWDEDKKKYSQIPWLSFVRYGYGEGDGRVELALNSKVKPYVLYMRKNFSQVLLKFAARLRSHYAQRIYEFVKAAAFRGHNVRIGLDELRTMLMIGPDKLQDFRNFRRIVLDVAAGEITERTDMRLAWRGERGGDVRGVTTIVFTWDEQPAGRKDEIGFLPDTRDDDLYRALKKVGMESGEAGRVVQRLGKTDPDLIRWHLDELQRKLKRGDVFRKSPLAWLRGGLKTDYRPQRSLFANMRKKVETVRANYHAREQIAPEVAASLDELQKHLTA